MRGYLQMSFMRMRDKSHWRNTLLLSQALLLALYPMTSAQAQTAPVGNGFTINAEDLRFIFHAIEVAQANSAGGVLLGSGPNQVNLNTPISAACANGAPCPGDAQLPVGLRTVDGTFNNIVPIPDQHLFGAADLLFPRLTTPRFRAAEGGTSYATVPQTDVIDSQPRIISNLIVDQSENNPAAKTVATNPCGSGGFVCSTPPVDPAHPLDPLFTVRDPNSGALFIPNITPDFGLSAPFNLMFTFFGQFFDHGLDLVTKGGSGTVVMPLQPDDPLFVPGSPTNFMAMARGQNQPGPDGILGTADDIQETMNTTTPWVDQNQTYTSHPSHQVFLRQYDMTTGRPLPDGKVLDGGHCSPRGTGIPGDEICNIGNWAEVKAQAATKLGIRLTDKDVFDVPLIATDPYGHFKPGPGGFPQLVRPGNVLVEGNPAGGGIAIPGDALRTGHGFLNDIAHNAVPNPGLIGVRDGVYCDFRDPACRTAPGTYDGDVLDAHMVTGDGRGNENIALTMVHNIFHAEHNRLVHDVDRLVNQLLTPAEIARWKAVDAASGWAYGERLFQAARFVTEMEYQHLVFEEFARKMQPLINPFLGGITSIDPAIAAEFAHTVYRLGHSMLPEVVGRINVDGSPNDIRLLNAFLNPGTYNEGGTAGPLSSAAAAGAIIRGTALQIGNELDEVTTSSVRNTLGGLPPDLPAVNIGRGRSEGIPGLNQARQQFFAATRDAVVRPYANWSEFKLGLRHPESFVNFVAAYAAHPSVTGAPTVAGKRAAAAALVAANDPILFAPSAQSGVDSIDFWPGGMAERPAVFGGLLGSTFNFVFEHQLEHLQDGDRFYYLQRTDGLDLRFSLEGNSFGELCRRNTTVGGTMGNIFNTADFIFTQTATGVVADPPIDPASGITLLALADGTTQFFDPLHQGKNILFNGGPGDDKFRGDVGDDTMHGNAGNDRMDGGEGNDMLFGGEGDDILFGGNGDDDLRGGPGNDAISGGPGFGGDILIGGDGNDFLLGGDDGVEYFGGEGNDIIIDGSTRSEGMFGGPGDDWIYDGDGHDGGLFGDNGNVFDLLAGLDPVGGDDVLGGGPGQDGHFGEGGDDIMLMSEGSNKFFGDYGFDWITQRGWPVPADIELALLAQPGVVLNFNDLRNRYRLVDGASGWDLDDHIQGDDRVDDPAAPPERQNLPGMELTVAGAAKIAGLTELTGPAGFNITLPWKAGNILLGGGGRDLIRGGAGNDLIDGDRWLDVELVATLNDGTVKRVWDPRDLIDDVFADPQRLNPGKIEIVRTIRTGAPAVDTAVFSNNLAQYDITLNANGSVTVVHARPPAKAILNDGTDTLVNVEVLQFANTSIAAPGANVAAVPNNIVNVTQTVASNRLTNAGLTVGTLTLSSSTTVAAGRVIGPDPVGGTFLFKGSPVNLLVSTGVPDAIPPTVSITSPVNGSIQPKAFALSATAADNVNVVGVQFFVDGAPFAAEDKLVPYTRNVPRGTFPIGPHTVSAVARDAAGNTATAAVTVIVQ